MKVVVNTNKAAGLLFARWQGGNATLPLQSLSLSFVITQLLADEGCLVLPSWLHSLLVRCRLWAENSFWNKQQGGGATGPWHLCVVSFAQVLRIECLFCFWRGKLKSGKTDKWASSELTIGRCETSFARARAIANLPLLLRKQIPNQWKG